MKPKLIFLSDGYKYSHVDQYPQGTEKVVSVWTPRKNAYITTHDGNNVHFGVKYLEEQLRSIFDEFKTMNTNDWDINLYNEVSYGGNLTIKHWLRLKHWIILNNGKIPLTIKALEDGTIVSPQTPTLEIQNTDPEFFWLVNYLETYISQTLWQGSTSATISRELYNLLKESSERTCDNLDLLPYQAHDFSSRGMSSYESSIISGLGHLQYFKGSDSIGAVAKRRQLYGDIPAGITKATEHSVMCAGGEDNELGTIEKLIDDNPTGLLSIVSDTWDYYNSIENIYPSLRDKIEKRDGKIVVRPDCFCDQTKILTAEGWIFFKNLTKKTLVAQVNSKGVYSFVAPSKIIKEYYEGDMYEIKDFHGKIDFSLTPNHRIVYLYKGELKEESVEHFNFSDCKKKIIRSAKSIDMNKKLKPIERLKIAFQADGSYTSSGNKISFSFSKKRKIERLKKIMLECNIEFKEYELSDDRKEIHLQVDSSIFRKDFEWVNIDELCSNWCKEFIEELSYWDATRRSEERFKFDTTNEIVAKKVEIIGLSAGYGVLKSEYEDNRKENFSNVHTLYIMKVNIFSSNSIKKSKVFYKGNVYCVTVPTGRIIVKRNRAIMVTGNSGIPIDIISDTLKILGEKFGYTLNSKGYKELNPKIGLIYGDGMNVESITKILQRISDEGWASNQVVFGVGSYQYQYNTRDVLGFAMKATYVEINGKSRNIVKNPKTDTSKKSLQGLTLVYKEDDTIKFIDNLDKETIKEQRKEEVRKELKLW